MVVHEHRPNKRLGRSDRWLVKITKDLTSFLTKAQRSLAYDTLHLSSRKRGILANILVEFAEDLYQDIGIWRSFEQYNLDFFGTKLPCVLQPDEAMDEEPVNPDRIRFLLWTLYTELEPDGIIAPNNQDLERLAIWIAEFLSDRFRQVQFDSGVKSFLTTPNQYGWEVKRKLVWMGQDSYLFRLHCDGYVRDHGGKPDIPTLDDFICQETTSWSGLGAIDILAATLDITESQSRGLRSWYERHAGYYRVVSIHEPLMEVVNILNEQPYTVRVGDNASELEGYQLMFGSLVAWDGEWYWSGMQHRFPTVTGEQLQQIQQEFLLKAPQVVYRYWKERAEKARAFAREHYQEFVDYFGKELIVYADGATMAAEMQTFLERQNASKPQETVAEFFKKHNRPDISPQMSFPPKLLAAEDGVGVYFNPDEGQEMMMRFDDVLSGFQKQGRDLNEDECETVRQFIYSDAISLQFVSKLVQEYGDESIASAFFIPQDCEKYYLDYVLRRYKGHFYRNRYPSLSILDD